MKKSLYVVVTYSDERSVLVEIANALMDAGFPSVHISSPSGQSFYWYKGQRCVSVEYMLDALCSQEMVNKVVEVIKQKHNYDLPAIIWYEVCTEERTYNWCINKG